MIIETIPTERSFLLNRKRKSDLKSYERWVAGSGIGNAVMAGEEFTRNRQEEFIPIVMTDYWTVWQSEL